jgi:hypothetical protein
VRKERYRHSLAGGAASLFVKIAGQKDRQKWFLTVSATGNAVSLRRKTPPFPFLDF